VAEQGLEGMRVHVTLNSSLKRRISWKKAVKSPQHGWGSAPVLQSCSRTYYYSFVECVSGVKRVLCLRKITDVTNSKICSAFVFSAFLRLFSLPTLQFLLVGAQKHFCPRAQGTLTMLCGHRWHWRYNAGSLLKHKMA